MTPSPPDNGPDGVTLEAKRMTADELLVLRAKHTRRLMESGDTVNALLDHIEYVERRLDREENEHAELQSRCFEGFPSVSDGIFDAYKELLRRAQPQSGVVELPRYEIIEAAAISWVADITEAYGLDQKLESKLMAGFKAGVRWLATRLQSSAPEADGDSTARNKESGQ